MAKRGRPKTSVHFDREHMKKSLKKQGYTRSTFCDDLFMHNYKIARKYKNGFFDSFTWYMKKQEMPFWVLDEIAMFLDAAPEYLTGEMEEYTIPHFLSESERIPSYSDHLIKTKNSIDIFKDYLKSIGISEVSHILNDEVITELHFRLITYCYTFLGGYDKEGLLDSLTEEEIKSYRDSTLINEEDL